MSPAGSAYGPDWENRGRSRLAAAALLLAALWPAGGPAAVHGSTVHQVSLRRRVPHRHISMTKAAIAAGIVIAGAAAGTAIAAAVSARSGAAATGPVGIWDEAYSSDPAHVNGQYSITESDGLYTITARTVIELPDGNCSLPPGTQEGTFSASGHGTFSGTEKVWYAGSCAYAYMSPFTATLSGNTMIMHVANAEPESFTFTRA